MRVLTLPSALKHYSKYCICFQIWSSRLLEIDVHLAFRTATKWLTRPTSWRYMHGIPAIASFVATTECVFYDVDFPRCSSRGAQSKANIVARRSSRLTEMGLRCRRFLRVLFFLVWYSHFGGRIVIWQSNSTSSTSLRWKDERRTMCSLSGAFLRFCPPDNLSVRSKAATLIVDIFEPSRHLIESYSWMRVYLRYLLLL